MGRKRRADPEIEEEVEEERSASESEGDEEQEGGRRKRRRGGKSAARGGRSAAAHGLVGTFFQQGQGAGAAGSGRTLADLQLVGAGIGGGAAPGGGGDGGDDAAGLRSLLERLPERHPEAKAALRARHRACFPDWWDQLRAGHSLLFYGFGSKFALLQQFAKEQLGQGDGACLAVNGLVPGLTAKQVLQWAVASLHGTKAAHYRGMSPTDLLDTVRSDGRRLYLVLHNIDGPGLREPDSQKMLSDLARLPNVHLAASVDHVNAALLWDQQTRDRFSWVWHNVTNYEPYLREVGFAAIPSLLAGRSAQCSKQSATVVLASLSASAREVFRLIAEAQMDPDGQKGISFQRLFQLCRERFLVSNEMLLKSFLTEFRDHELLGTRRGADGGELLHVPLAEDVLEQVLADAEAMT